jgi:anti-sigma B factor antagonist
MNITKTLENGLLTVLIDGKLDTSTTPQATAEIEADLDSAEELVIDMKDLKYISSVGLRLMLSLHKKMTSKGGMKLINVNETNMEIFDFTGFADIMNIE